MPNVSKVYENYKMFKVKRKKKLFLFNYTSTELEKNKFSH